MGEGLFDDTHPVPMCASLVPGCWGYRPKGAQSCCPRRSHGLGGAGGETEQLQGGVLEGVCRKALSTR